MLPTVYTPFEQTPFLWMYVMVRTAGDPTAVTRSIRSVVREVEPSLTAANIRPMAAVVSDTVSERRFNMLLVSTFAVLALTLAAIGIYGVIAYSVSQRTHEIGLRMALGAARSDVLSMIVREGVLTAGLGVAAGLAAASAGSGLLRDLLVDIAPKIFLPRSSGLPWRCSRSRSPPATCQRGAQRSWIRWWLCDRNETGLGD